MSPKLIKPTLGRSGKAGREQHTPQLMVDIASPHYGVEGAKVTIRVRSPVVRRYVRDLEPLGKRVLEI